MREIEQFKTLGLDTNCARCLIALNELKRASSKDLQAKCGLRQPEISMALKKMKGYGWISSYMDKDGRAGRPKSVYFLKENMTGIISSLQACAEEDFVKRKSAAEALISLFDNTDPVPSSDKSDVCHTQK